MEYSVSKTTKMSNSELATWCSRHFKLGAFEKEFESIEELKYRLEHEPSYRKEVEEKCCKRIEYFHNKYGKINLIRIYILKSLLIAKKPLDRVGIYNRFVKLYPEFPEVYSELNADGSNKWNTFIGREIGHLYDEGLIFKGRGKYEKYVTYDVYEDKAKAYISNLVATKKV